MIKIKVASGLSAVLSTGQFQNMRPSFNAEIEMEIDEKTPIDPAVKGMQKRLYGICEGMVGEVAEKAKIAKVKAEMANFHWIKLPDGKEVPSVTAIIGVNAPPFEVSEEDLNQYASQSLICHGQVAHFIDTGKWVEPKDLESLWADIRVVQLGNLQLELSGWSFPNFLEAFPIRTMKNGHQSFSKKWFYGGTPDFTGIPMWSKIKGYEHVEEIPTLFDVKRTKSLVSNAKQMAAYSRMEGYEGIEQLCIVELNAKTKQGFSKPEVITKEKNEGYFQMFMRDRETFRKIYGL
jgi:hypothetical protein